MEVEIRYDGTVAGIELMMDSMQAAPLDKAGDVTISDIKFATQGEVVDIKPSENNGIDIGGQNVKFNTSAYIINTDEESNSMNVTYSNVSGKGYTNISADVTAVAAGKGEFAFKVVNNGEETVKLRIDILAGETNIANSVKVAGNSVNSFTASDSATVEVAAKATETITVGFAGTATTANIFIDSSTWNDETTHSGDVTFSEMAFSGEGTVVDPKPDPDPAPSGDGALLTFIEQGGYKVDKKNVAANEVNITYEGITCNYANVYASVVTADTENKNTFTFTVVNNGDKAVQIRMDLQNTSDEVVSTDIKGTSVWKNNGEMYFKVEAGKTETITITYSEALKGMVIFIDSTIADAPEGTTYSGNITFKDFKFTNVA